ncbi:MAG: hypothetical protein ACTSRZ_17750, partial [Promethearchaeota archaeon]
LSAPFRSKMEFSGIPAFSKYGYLMAFWQFIIIINRLLNLLFFNESYATTYNLSFIFKNHLEFYFKL